MSESWDNIKAQIDAQIQSLEFIEKYGREEYLRVHQIQETFNPTINYKPKQGLNVEGLWSSFETTFEIVKDNKYCAGSEINRR